MADKSTFIKLDRNILNWRWFHDANTLKVWIYILAKCNIKDHDFEDITIKRGEFVTSYATMSKELEMSTKSIRTALNHLKGTSEVASTSTNKYTLISVPNYNLYQDIGASKTASKGQAMEFQQKNEGQQYKNVKNDKNVRSSSSVPLPPTQTDIFSFAAENNLQNVDCVQFFTYYDGTGWKTKKGEPITDWQSLLIRWDKSEKKKPEQPKANYAAYNIDLFEKMLNEKE